MAPILETGGAEEFGHVASPEATAGATRRDVMEWTVKVIASEPAAKGGFIEYLLEVQVAGLVKNIVRKRCPSRDPWCHAISACIFGSRK
jgi:hypothetical protein